MYGSNSAIRGVRGIPPLMEIAETTSVCVAFLVLRRPEYQLRSPHILCLPNSCSALKCPPGEFLASFFLFPGNHLNRSATMATEKKEKLDGEQYPFLLCVSVLANNFKAQIKSADMVRSDRVPNLQPHN